MMMQQTNLLNVQPEAGPVGPEDGADDDLGRVAHEVGAQDGDHHLGDPLLLSVHGGLVGVVWQVQGSDGLTCAGHITKWYILTMLPT